MRGKVTTMPRGLTARVCAGVAVVATALSVFAGSATAGQIEATVAKVDAAVARVEAPALKVWAPAALELPPVKGPSVARLRDGRDGFIITEVPAMEEAWRTDFDRAVALLADREYGRAIDVLEKVIALSPGVTAPYIDIAIAYQRVGKPERAEEHLRTALTLFPGHPAACNEFGLLYRKTGRFAEARAIYEKAVDGFPEYYPAHKNLGIVCDLYLNDPACALEHYEIYSKARPEDGQVKLWIADVRARRGRD